MEASIKIKNYIKAKETLQLHAYNDGTGNWAIGYGHTWHHGEPESITPEQANGLFEIDLEACEHAIDYLVKTPLLQYEYDALISFIFNDGVHAFELSSILRALNERSKIEACSWLPRYCHVNQVTASEGLLKRRIDESNIFLGRGAPNYD